MNILSFDVESNGLHGAAFAVAGLLMSQDRKIITQFVGRCPIEGPVDAWVSENVLGPMEPISNTAPDARTMRNAFWNWYVAAKAQANIIVAANPYPVEARFLIDCQNDDMASRNFDHPFPYLDLSSMLYTLGYKTAVERRAFVKKAVRDFTGESHNPLWDAKATALAALEAVKVSEN